MIVIGDHKVGKTTLVKRYVSWKCGFSNEGDRLG